MRKKIILEIIANIYTHTYILKNRKNKSNFIRDG